MKWYQQLHWKFFISHLVIIIIAVVALLTAANAISGFVLEKDVPFYAGVLTDETTSTQLNLDPVLRDILLERFQLVVQEALLVAALAALAAAMVMSLFISRGIVEPIQAVSAVSHRLAQGFYRERTIVNADDEIGQLSRSINQLAEALEQTEQRRRALLADVTHELRTPLSTIEGYMEGLLDGVVKPNNQTFTLILRESVRMQRLIEDLDLLSRAEAGQISISPRAIDLRQVLETLLARFTPEFNAKEITLQSKLTDTILAVWADPDRIDQVIINLLSNAKRYTYPDGNVQVSAWTEEERVVVAIRDSGIGIERQHLSHIFERFYRVDKSRSRSSGGSGIGLTIARYLIYAHGGDLYAESKGLGLGATFYFTLPRASAFAVNMQASNRNKAALPRETLQPASETQRQTPR